MIYAKAKLMFNMVWTLYSLRLVNSFSVPLFDINGDVCAGSNWVQFNSSCYYFSKESADDAFQAQKACVQSNSQLVSIGSKQEQDFVSSQINTHYEYWIGLFKKSCKKNAANYWIDGTPLSVTFWFHSEPDEDVCCNRLFNNGLWRDKSCDTAGMRYICKKPKMWRARQSIITKLKLSGSYLVSDTIFNISLPECRHVFCSITCLANYICNGFNMRKNVGLSDSGCFCEFKSSGNSFASSFEKEKDSSYWEVC